MAIINRVYPHVNVTTQALIRPSQIPADTNATTLFVPFFSQKGRANQINKIFNLSQFVSEYGEPDFALQGRTILNVYNWLNAGGAISALRLTGDSATAKGTWASNLEINAKYPGLYYNSLSVVLSDSIYSSSTVKFIDAEVRLNNRRIQVFYKLSASDFVKVLSESEYFGEVKFLTTATFASISTLLQIASHTIVLSGGLNTTSSLDQLVGAFFRGSYELFTAEATSAAQLRTIGETVTLTVTSTTGLVAGERIKIEKNSNNFVTADVTLVSNATTFSAKIVSVNEQTAPVLLPSPIDGSLQIVPTGAGATQLSIFELANEEATAFQLLGNRLETPIDLILDAGYSLSTKSAIKDFTDQVSGDRSDIVVIFDEFDFSGSSVTGTSAASFTSTSLNHAVYTQRLIVSDVISGKDVWVTPTFFLASLIPANDRIFGIQFPTAGLTRGVLTGVKGIDTNPNEQRKQDLYRSKINYIEKDSRGYRFMSQSTKNQTETALRFLNNVRVTSRMVRELEDLGREYLF